MAGGEHTHPSHPIHLPARQLPVSHYSIPITETTQGMYRVSDIIVRMVPPNQGIYYVHLQIKILKQLISIHFTSFLSEDIFREEEVALGT